MIWARQFASGNGAAAQSVNLMSAIAGDLGMTTLPPGTTVIRLIIEQETFFDPATSTLRQHVFGIKPVPFNVVLPAAANFGPLLAQHSDWMWWSTASRPAGAAGVAFARNQRFDIRSARKMPEVESTLALYYESNAGVAADTWALQVSALLKLP